MPHLTLSHLHSHPLTLHQGGCGLEHSTPVLCAFLDALSLHFFDARECSGETLTQHAWSIHLRRGDKRKGKIHYLFDQMLLSISRHSQIVAAPPDVLSEIVTALEY